MLDLEAIAAGVGSLPTTLAALLAPIDQSQLAIRPEPGEWSCLEVVGHLIVCDGEAFRDRVTSILDGVAEISGFDPWAAINARDYRAEQMDTLIKELTEERRRSVEFILGLGSADLASTASHPSGQFAASDFLLEWCFHDRDHLQQILENLKQFILPQMTVTMRQALVG